MHRAFKLSALLPLTLVGACATLPSGPSMLVLPGSSKTFDQFRFDDDSCRRFAYQQVGGKTANEVAADSGVRSAVIGSALGAAAGALIGGGQGAGIGAGAGLLLGGAAGVGAAESSSYSTQQRYDFGYQQCMYAKGHRVPVSGRFAAEVPRGTGYRSPPPPPVGAAPSPPPGATSRDARVLPPPPPPPPGAPPPPPPGVAPATSGSVPPTS